MVVGHTDHPVYEVDLTGPKEVRPAKPSLTSPFLGLLDAI